MFLAHLEVTADVPCVSSSFWDYRSGSTFDNFHKEHPNEPMMATECCSCLSQRGEDFDACPVPRTCVGSSCHVDCAHDGKAEQSNGTFYNNEISQCTAQQVNESDSRKFVAGTFVWSGFDVSWTLESRHFCIAFASCCSNLDAMYIGQSILEKHVGGRRQ